MKTRPYRGVVRSLFPLLIALLAAIALHRLPSAHAAVAAPPAVLNITDEPWSAIDRYVEAERQTARLPGIALGIVQGDRVVHLAGFGQADPTGRAVTAETPFMIG